MHKTVIAVALVLAGAAVATTSHGSCPSAFACPFSVLGPDGGTVAEIDCNGQVTASGSYESKGTKCVGNECANFIGHGIQPTIVLLLDLPDGGGVLYEPASLRLGDPSVGETPYEVEFNFAAHDGAPYTAQTEVLLGAGGLLRAQAFSAHSFIDVDPGGGFTSCGAIVIGADPSCNGVTYVQGWAPSGPSIKFRDWSGARQFGAVGDDGFEPPSAP